MSARDIIRFIKEDVWRISLKGLPLRKFLLIKHLRIVLLAFKGFNEDKCTLRAKALTFYSLMSIVPLLAFGFGIAKGFGMQKVLEDEVRKYFAEQVQIVEQVHIKAEDQDGNAVRTIEKINIDKHNQISDGNPVSEQGQGTGQVQLVEKIIDFSNNMLNETKGGLIAGIGIIVLLYTVFNLLQNIEESFNEIWGVPHSRSFRRKFSDYLSALFIGPILFILSSGVTVFVKTKITPITEKIILLGPIISHVIFISLNMLPFLVIWLLLIFVYIFMPNTRVRFVSAFTGGIVAGTIYVLWQYIYLALQIGVAKYGAIYGSLAVIPLFMFWLQISWLIVLFGAEIAFAHQNVETYEMEPLSENVSTSLKKILALRISNICVKNFINGESPWSAQKISEILELPVRLTNKLLADLVKCRVLSVTEGDDEKIDYYQPARDVNSLTIQYVSSSLDKLGNDKNITFAGSEEMEKIKSCYEKLDSIYSESDANILLKDI